MSFSFNRRRFIKSTSLAGMSVALATTSYSLPSGSQDHFRIDGKYFSIAFDVKTGTFSVVRSDGGGLLTGATAALNYTDPKVGKVLSDGHFRFTADAQPLRDAIGNGKALVVRGSNDRRKIEVEVRFTLYDDQPVVAVETTWRNSSKDSISIRSIEPIRAVEAEGAAFHVPGVSKCLTNGEMYFDAGRLHTFGTTDDGISSGNLKGVKLANGPICQQVETVHSWWNAGLFSGQDNQGVAIGYIDNNHGLGNLLLARPRADELSLVAETVFAPQLVWKSGTSIGSNRFVVVTGDNPYESLERYAYLMGTMNGARTASILNGWCSWFYTLSKVSEAEVVANTAFASKNLRPYGLEYIQVDEGYQQWHGQWEGNDRFPHGMKWLADQIKSYGFKAGLWISPYVVSEPTVLFKEHPEWLLHRKDGSLQRVGNWEEGEAPPADENPKRYGLDITHPGAAQWLHDLIDTIVNQWGYEMIKIDFVAWSILAAEQYHDPSMSAAAVYRKGMNIMRQAAGEKCHILECGPGAVTTGLIDSMRIEADVYYGFREAAWETYFTHPAGSAVAAAHRYYFHKRTRINDADHLCMDLLTLEQSRAAATLIALSGGNLFSGGRLVQLEGSKFDILKKITPSFGEAAIPVDLFDQDMPNVFALHIQRDFGKWTVVGFFNPGLTETMYMQFDLERLWLDPSKTYIAFDFWKEEFAGEMNGDIRVAVAPGTVTLLTLHEKTGRPQFLSTNRHVSQGGVEIQDVRWNEQTHVLSGRSTGPSQTSHKVFIYVPDRLDWTWAGSALYHDEGNYSLKLVDYHLIRVDVRFDEKEEVVWKLSYDDFMKG